MPDDLSQLWSLARGVALLCPPLTGLLGLSIVSRLVPARWHLAYWTLGLAALTGICQAIVRANPNPGPDPTVLTSGLFAQIGWVLCAALAGALLYRWARSGSMRANEPA